MSIQEVLIDELKQANISLRARNDMLQLLIDSQKQTIKEFEDRLKDRDVFRDSALEYVERLEEQVMQLSDEKIKLIVDAEKKRKIIAEIWLNMPKQVPEVYDQLMS